MPFIESYSFGNIVINGARYSDDIKIIAGRVISGWWRKQGHLMRLDDIRDILDAAPAVLIVGTGSSGMMRVAPEVEKELNQRGITLHIESTGRATQRYNTLSAAGRSVAAALHLSC